VSWLEVFVVVRLESDLTPSLDHHSHCLQVSQLRAAEDVSVAARTVCK